MQTPGTFVQILYENPFLKLEEWAHPVTGRPWYVVRCTNSVSGLLHDVVNKRVLLIRSNHIAAQYETNPCGTLITPFAGRFDRLVSPKQLLIDEGWEELRAVIPEQDVCILNNGVSMVLSIGIITERGYLCYAQITEGQLSGSDNETFGLASEGEEINRHWVSEDEFLADDYTCVDMRVFAFRQHIQIMRLREQIVHLQIELSKHI